MVFHAHIINTDSYYLWRVLLVAPSLEVMDEWWRLTNDSKAYPSVKRITPEWYTYSRTELDVYYTIKSGGPAESIASQVVTLLQEEWNNFRQWNMIDSQQRATDQRSGNVFYIRSTADPRLFWYHSERDSTIQLFEGRGTPFKISIPAKSGDEGKVMIGSDPINISVLTKGSNENGNAVSAGDDGVLHVGTKPDTFHFSDLRGGFLAPSSSDKRISKVSVGQNFELVQ